ncbi:hypothetical protein [uncultured Draconibacterium sp.]|uniref:hypothetical protein n=1 Tax=uncultured Draconibacterium sp. TaxID=1573823 RepID=UPI003217C834
MEKKEIQHFSGILGGLIAKAQNGESKDIDFIMSNLSSDSNLAMTRFVDFVLSLVNTPAGFKRIFYYLFSGTSIQRNYASLYLNRLGELEYVKQAYEKGLIDEIQAFAR